MTSHKLFMLPIVIGLGLQGLAAPGGAVSWPNHPLSIALDPTHKAATPTTESIQPAAEPLDVLALEQSNTANCLVQPCTVASSLPIELTSILIQPSTQPSLWWYRDQAKPGLIQTWLVYEQRLDQLARVDFVINRGLWSSMDYLARYAFVNSMGAATSRFGYNSRFFSLQQNSQNRLATYTCDFQQTPSLCQLVLESVGLNRFR